MITDHLQRDFEIQIAKSEYKRNQLMTGLVFLGFFIVIVNYLLIDEETIRFYGGPEGFLITGAWMLTLFFYELIALFISRTMVLSGRPIKYDWRLLHIGIEVIFPSALLLYYINNGMISAIDAPIAFVYFLYSVMSILCLDFRISLFTGILSGLMYGSLVYWGFENIEMAVRLPSNPSNTYFVRALLIIMSGGAAAFVASSVRRTLTSLLTVQNEKIKIEKLFGQQVSKEVVDALVDENLSIKRQEATVMALDLRNFSVFAEHRSPDQIMEFQNQVFGPIIEIINQHQGIVNQIMGDGLMATFGSPNYNPLHADMAFQASLKILSKMKELNDRQMIPPTRLGLGLHSGEVITGNIGNERRKQFSTSGTAVIIAFRVEQLNKEFDCNLLITEEVKNRIEPGKIPISFLGSKPLKGFGNNINIYRVDV